MMGELETIRSLLSCKQQMCLHQDNGGLISAGKKPQKVISAHGVGGARGAALPVN